MPALKIVKLVEERLGIKSSPQRVQIQAKRLGLTRARIYQLFEMCADIMAVRWPEGEALFQRLYQKFASSTEARTQYELVRGLLELIYPTVGVGAAIAPGQRGAGRQIERPSDRDGARRGDRDFSRPRTNQRSTQAVSARY